MGTSYSTKYTINGLLNPRNSALSNLAKLANSAGAWMTYDTHEGKFAVVINKSGTSNWHFTDDNIISSINIAFTPLDKLYNTVKVTYPHEDLKGESDWVQIAIPQADRMANEFDNVLQLSYDIVTNPVQAELLGFIELKQSRVDKVVTFKTDYSMMGIKAGDLFDITNSVYGWTEKVFRVISVAESDKDDGTIEITITGLEYDESVYDEDLTRYIRTDSSGIIPLASLSPPTKPIITLNELVSRPYVKIDTSLIDGVVTSIEVWSSKDVTLADNLREYSLLKTITTGDTLPLNTTISTEVDSVSASTFVVKCRACNSDGVSVFSLPSDTAYYQGTQVTDQITDSVLTPDPFNPGQLLNLSLPLLLKLLYDFVNSGGTSKGGHVRISQSDGSSISNNMNGIQTDGAKGTLTRFNEFSFTCQQTGTYLMKSFVRFGAASTTPVESHMTGFIIIYPNSYHAGYLGSASEYIANTASTSLFPGCVDYEVNTDWSGDQYSDMWLERVVSLQAGTTYYVNTFYCGTSAVTQLGSKVVELILIG